LIRLRHERDNDPPNREAAVAAHTAQAILEATRAWMVAALALMVMA
jgi:hypothetical protein